MTSNITAKSPLQRLALTLGVEADEPLLQEALTHRSAQGLSYERLEFLGDRVLNLAVADWVYRRCADEAEGVLSLIHTHLVRGATCAAVAEHLALWPLLAPSLVQEVPIAGRQRLLADAMEALLAVVYLSKGMVAVQTFIETHWQLHWAEALAAKAKDAKTALQEVLQAKQLPLPIYTDAGKHGPDHSATFTVNIECALGRAQGQGPSKAVAGMRAAEALLAQIEQTEVAKK